MKTMIALLAGTAAIALAPAALAQHAPSVVLNGQVNFNDVQALNVVNVHEAAGAAVSSVGLGNTMSSRSDNNSVSIDSDQALYGNVVAHSTLNAGTVRDASVVTAVAQGNAAQGSVCCGASTGQFVQSSEGHDITAVSEIHVGSGGQVLAAQSAAVANNAANHARNGYVDMYANQYNSSRVTSISLIEACCNNTSATASAQSVANAWTLTGEGSTQYGQAQQINDGDVGAHAAIRMNVATNPTAATSAAGNTASLDNTFGYAQLDGYQENNGNITASSEISLNDFFGQATVGANAMGNSALLSNIGSDATMSMYQNNFGDVTANAVFNGATSRGGVGVSTATAIGNAQTVASCAGCGDGSVKIEGYATQYNYGNVTATSTVNAGVMGGIVSSATAVGNSATFVGRQGGH
ncbi:MAG: holdfast anchor protein HfaD [Hyphomonadaceae bacterium]|jgi:hypothetical protein|nr:holdfast anchor protein HfaD [Hyphomonadaceae bacterium]